MDFAFYDFDFVVIVAFTLCSKMIALFFLSFIFCYKMFQRIISFYYLSKHYYITRFSVLQISLLIIVFINAKICYLSEVYGV